MRPNTEGKLCFSVIPARFVFIFLTSCGLFLCYAFKGFLSVAIVAMVRHSNVTLIIDQSECPADHLEDNTDEWNGEFDWDSQQQAIILGAFFYGYVATQIPFGIATEKFSTKWMFGSCILISALLSLIGPIAANWGFVPFLVTRLGQGLTQGIIVPGMNVMIAKWMPKIERSRAVSIILGGSAIGSVVSMPLTGYLCNEKSLGGWPSIFYVLGIAGCVWFVFWSFLVYDTPELHPFITESELDFIHEGQGDEKISLRRTVPWKAILTSYRVYALMITNFAYGWGYLTILTLMPTYYKNILHMDIKTNGLISSLPYITQAVVSFLFSYVTDKLRGRGYSITLLRKINNSIAFFGSGLCLIAIIFVKCDQKLNVLFFILSLGFIGFCSPGYQSNYVDMAPDFAGVLTGYINSFGNIPGFAAPSLAAYYYSDGHTLHNWSLVFYTCAGIYFLCQIIYLLFGTSELQAWGLTKKYVNKYTQEISDLNE